MSTPTTSKDPKQHIAWLAVVMRSIADSAEPVGYSAKATPRKVLTWHSMDQEPEQYKIHEHLWYPQPAITRSCHLTDYSDRAPGLL